MNNYDVGEVTEAVPTPIITLLLLLLLLGKQNSFGNWHSFNWYFMGVALSGIKY